MTFLFQSKQNNENTVAYLRHSAEDKQENSIPIQRGHVKGFARKYNLNLIGEETDEGVSGLTANRPGLKRLFDNWIRNPEAVPFKYILVYDISRWGRFQDSNEGAALEFEAKRYGKQVIYVDEGFLEEDDLLNASLTRPVRRYMAAEYSRQLSGKVFHGSIKVSEQGFSAGGMAPYGMTRILLDEQRKPIGALKPGEHKVIANQRVTFAPANDATTEVIRRIFTLVANWHRPEDVAAILNREGVPSAKGGLWNREKIVRILSNEVYIGTRVYNKTWGRLKKKKRTNPRNEWVIRPNSFEAIIDLSTFKQVQENMYWLTSARWKNGTRTIQRVNKTIREQLNMLESLGEYSEDTKWHATKRLPLVFGVTFYRDAVSQWCFLISEAAKRYERVIAIGLDLDQRDPTSRFFVLPTSSFGVGNCLAFTENDDVYAQHQVETEQAELAIVDLYREVAEAF